MTVGYDYDGTVSAGIIPKNGVIVTNRPKTQPITKLPQGYEGIPIYYNPNNPKQEHDPIKGGVHKALTAQKLGLTSFYENEPVQAKIIKQFNPSMDVHLVSKGKTTVI